jgi:alanyl-tRNA synthetase
MLENSKNYFAPMHTAEHILNQTMVQKFGCQRSFSNHIERKKSKCDYYFDKNLTEQEILEIEENVNHIILQNIDIEELILNFDEAAQMVDLAKFNKEENQKIRIIKVGNYDICPCSGDHVKNTSEIGKFKISTTTYENNILRLRYKLTNE